MRPGNLLVDKLIRLKNESPLEIFGMAGKRRDFDGFAACQIHSERPNRIALVVFFFDQKELFDFAETVKVRSLAEQSVSRQRDVFIRAVERKFCDRREKLSKCRR